MSKVTKVLLLLEGTYPWYRGGVSEWVAQYLAAFPDYQFHILQVSTDEYLHKELHAALYALPGNVTGFNRIAPPNLNNDWTVEARKWYNEHLDEILVATEGIDLIHVTNTGFAGWLGARLASQNKKPLILTEHAIYWKEIAMGAVALECGYKIPRSRSRKLYFVEAFKLMAKEIYASSDYVISVSECNVAEQKKLGAKQPLYIGNGVGSEFFKKTERTGKHEKLVIGWIGRCANMKNPLRFFDLIESFRKKTEDGVSFVMMLSYAGEKKLVKEVKQRARKYPQLELIWNRPAIEHIHKMDSVCITSYNESQPLVLFEALANKSLPVGWKTGDVTDAYGIFVDQHQHPDILANRVLELWQDQLKWNNEVQSRYRFLLQEHTWNVVFSRYRDIIESICS